jgi:hypothetical protein
LPRSSSRKSFEVQPGALQVAALVRLEAEGALGFFAAGFALEDFVAIAHSFL